MEELLLSERGLLSSILAHISGCVSYRRLIVFYFYLLDQCPPHSRLHNEAVYNSHGQATISTSQKIKSARLLLLGHILFNAQLFISSHSVEKKAQSNLPGSLSKSSDEM